MLSANSPNSRATDLDKLAEVNRRISLGEINTVNGIVVRTPLPAGLVREDGKVIYPISDGIPLLVSGRGHSSLIDLCVLGVLVVNSSSP